MIFCIFNITNVTKRLQKLESEFKTVLSLYNAADKSRKNLECEMHADHKPQKNNAGKSLLFDTGDARVGKPIQKSSVSDNQNLKPVKNERSPETFQSKIPTARKPGSAPSSGMSTISEEDQFIERRCLMQNFKFRKNLIGKSKNEMQPKNSFDNAEWYDCSSPVDLSLSASKTLMMAQEVLEKNHYFSKDEEGDYKHGRCRKDQQPRNKNPEESPKKATKTRSPSNEKTAKSKNVTELLPTKKLVKKKSATLTENKANRTVSWVGSLRPLEYSDGLKPKRPLSANLKKRAPSPLASPEGGKKAEKSNDQLNCPATKHSKGRSSTVGAKENEKSKELSKNKEKMVKFEKPKPPKEKGYESEESTDSSKLKSLSPAKEYKSQLPQRCKDPSDGETAKHQIKEVLEKNSERMEELRRSKNLALDVAKQLKEKYDEIKDSNQELFEKFRKIQEKNENLQHELRTIMEEKLRLQLQIDGLRQESQTILHQQEIKWSDLMQENAILKERYKEMEKLYKEEISERDVRIKQLLKERFSLESLEVTKLVQKKTAEYQSLLEKQEETNKDLIERVNILEEQLQSARDKEKRITEAKNETSKQAAEAKEELRRLVAEKSEMESTVENLRSCLEYSQQQLEKLESKSAKQEKELQFQMKQLQQKHLNWRKDELKKKIKSLEEDLLAAPKEVVQDLQKTQTVLQELENQVQEKQKEWESHLEELLKEKERACSVAEYATKKLMETTNEFQKQSELNKKLQRALAESLAEKDRHITVEREKANNVRIKEIMSELHPDTKIRNSPRPYRPVDEESEWLHKKIYLRSPKRHKSRGLHSEPRSEDPSHYFYSEDHYS